MSAPEPFRSAVPLAAAGIVCLGLLPILGGPDRPLHWAMTVGMVGFGSLLWTRRRLRGPEGPSLKVPSGAAARHAGRTLLLIGAVVATLVGAIVGFRLHSGGAMSAWSVGLPAAGLLWVAVLGLQVLRHRDPVAESSSTSDRPSRRPPPRDARGQATSTSSHPGPPDQRVSA